MQNWLCWAVFFSLSAQTTTYEVQILELPNSHAVPFNWLKDNASPSIVLRLCRDVLSPNSSHGLDLDELQAEVQRSKTVLQIERKQGTTGVWSRNMLGLAASKTAGLTGVGTIHQYRRLIELGVPADSRVLQKTNRIFFKILSRDDDSSLLFENKKAAQSYPTISPWFRHLLRQAATCALSQAGLGEDPRVRGAAHKIATQVSQFLRSELMENPFEKKGAKWILNPEAIPPTIFSVAMISYLPSFQRERAGFVARLGEYLGRPVPKKAFVHQFGRKSFPPTFDLLGDPLAADSAGHPKDLPFALHWLEVMARLDALENSATGKRILGRLLRECNADGIWSPPKLPRSFAPSPSKLGSFYYPIAYESRTNVQRRTDVTLRLASIARALGWDLTFV